ncbi:GTP cyclohydrolase IIa [Candidatus Micrarchaeota archaeon]|nr:GTP cyclohydrolase IIa [Candidatus Micrarchaeota archaeon]
MIQTTLFQIDNYGPWTLTRGLAREPKLQILQSELYTDIQKLISKKGGIAFYTRFDNILALTSGISIEHHKKIQRQLNSKHPFTVSIGIGQGNTAFEAQDNATQAIQKLGSSQSKERKKIFGVQNIGKSNKNKVELAHFDVNSITQLLTDTSSAFEVLHTITNIQQILSKELMKKKAVLFFVGGDNFISISHGLGKRNYLKILKKVKEKTKLSLKVGIGTAQSPMKALALANKGLELIRRKKTNGQISIISGI